MVTQNKLSTCEGKHVFLEINFAVNLKIKRLKQIKLSGAPIFELPSNISTIILFRTNLIPKTFLFIF